MSTTTVGTARPDWKRARAAARILREDPDRTEKAFEVIQALDPDRNDRGFARVVARPEGRALYARRPDLMAALQDRSALEGLPEGSFGRAFLAHIDRFRLSPTKLVELGRQARGGQPPGDGPAWFAERHILIHDLRHVLTGYAADPRGETLLLWFSHGHDGGRSNRLLMVSSLFGRLRGEGPLFVLACLRAWLRGRFARRLEVQPFEDLLPLPLAEVRRRLRIAP
ncbi:Coq4 family protein [Phenylobacterium sp.]|uniref:Coq4 family protein n=1 Tax=Phenylobacterium sp. TaxID=1871053 RepID=UPI002FE3F39A